MSTTPIVIKCAEDPAAHYTQLGWALATGDVLQQDPTRGGPLHCCCSADTWVEPEATPHLNATTGLPLSL